MVVLGLLERAGKDDQQVSGWMGKLIQPFFDFIHGQKNLEQVTEEFGDVQNLRDAVLDQKDGQVARDYAERYARQMLLDIRAQPRTERAAA
ncbi:MAG: hypothetical protein HY319_07520 [Armatimonadetes bacterium]|nr:hypothetical protein [Armatimonadota bacterium]